MQPQEIKEIGRPAKFQNPGSAYFGEKCERDKKIVSLYVNLEWFSYSRSVEHRYFFHKNYIK